MAGQLRTALIWLVLFGLACCVLGTAEQGGLTGFPFSGPPQYDEYGNEVGMSLFGGLTPILFVVLLVLGALGALVWWGRRQQAQGVGQMTDFRKHKARLLQPGAEATRFTDVGGAHEAKAALADVVDWLKNPERYAKANVRPPRGVLLEGPPGTGKTLLARAVAGEAGAKFFVANATEFVEMFVGVGPARMRDLFETARKNEPCVVFIDELDAIGRRRGSGVGFSNEEREHSLNELLVQMDGFTAAGRVVVLAASNRGDVLDAALVRPGRFEQRIRVGDLSATDREEVLRVHVRGRELAADVNLAALAGITPGFTGAMLEMVANQAAMRAMRRAREGGSGVVAAADFEAARMGAANAEGPISNLDRLLVESASQLAEPVAPASVALELVDGRRLVGHVLWANAELLKINLDTGESWLVNRRELKLLRESPPSLPASPAEAASPPPPASEPKP